MSFSNRGTSLVYFPEKGTLQSFPANVRQGWKCKSVTNTAAFYILIVVAAVESFRKEAHEGMYGL
jgi:hypothetical protein